MTGGIYPVMSVSGIGRVSSPREWNGTNERGESVSSGVYFYRLVAGTTTLSKKMVLVK